MKIAHVVDSMELGGAEMLVSQMCHLQRSLGHDPCVYAIAELGVLGEKLRDEGFAVETNVGEHFLDCSRTFYRIFKESQPHVVHAHNPTPTVYAAAPARMSGVPCIVSTRHSLVARPHQKLAELKYAAAAVCCDWIVGVCDATVNNLKSIRTLLQRKIVRVYNGASPLSSVAPEKWPPKDGFVLLYVGRLAPVKNHTLLMSAFRDALIAMPDLQLWMVGDGCERRSLETLAAQLGIFRRVIFWGNRLDLAPFYAAADAFIMSSSSEGLPISLLQAFSVGLPAIVTNVGGMAEAVLMAKAGVTVPLASAAEMAAAILRLASNDAERKQFSAGAKNTFHQLFTIEAMTMAYMDLYRSALNDAADR